MKYTIALFVASAAMTSAQVVYNETTGQFICPAATPNGAFCAGTSQQTNIIIRCTNGVGQPGNCNDNLAGRPPTGVRYSPCFESAPLVGDAACSRNCIVYPENGKAPFTIPGCTPESFPTTLSTFTSHPTTIVDPSHTPSGTPYPNVTSTSWLPPFPTTTITDVFPPHPTTLVPTGTGTGIPHPPQNGTNPTTNPTRTPTGPTTTATQPPQFTGAADRNTVGTFAGVLAFGALFML